MSDRMEEMNFWDPDFFGFGGPHLELLICGGLRLDTQKAPLRSVHFPLVPLVCSKTFPVGCAQDTGNSAVALVTPSLKTSGIFLHNRVCYPHIYAFTTEILQIHCI